MAVGPVEVDIHHHQARLQGALEAVLEAAAAAVAAALVVLVGRPGEWFRNIR